MSLNKVKVYVFSVAAALGVGLLSAYFTRGNMDIYETAVMPPLAPPSILFPIVWTILYVLMGIGSAMVFLRGGEGLLVYAASLIVNFFWCILFFNARAFYPAAVWLVILWVLVGWTIEKYFQSSRTAALLQVPYFIWVTFALYLNWAIAVLN